ncbi:MULTISPECIES: DUF6922 domain-containing protein [Bacteroides]|uniref:DUF6922 domain-containing protein n=1 Tax=Bacteroides TaxID=816 RepID=UPI0039774E1B
MHPSYIIQRVMEYGQLEDWHLIRSYYGLDKIVSVCQSLRSLDPRALAYMLLYFKYLKRRISLLS